MGSFLEFRDGVRYSNSEPTGGEEIVIVLSVAYTRGIPGRDTEVLQRGEQPVAFVDTGRIDQDGALVVGQVACDAGFFHGTIYG